MSSSDHSNHSDAWWEALWPFLVIGWGVLVALFVLIITQSTLPN